MVADIKTYNNSLDGVDQKICELLKQEIDQNLKDSESKIWHGHPVWFINGNPIVGYAKLKQSIQLLFWSGQSFNEPNLKDEGTFKASEIRFTDIDQINISELHNWLQKAHDIQWDYKNIVKRKGVLERI